MVTNQERNCRRQVLQPGATLSVDAIRTHPYAHARLPRSMDGELQSWPIESVLRTYASNNRPFIAARSLFGGMIEQGNGKWSAKESR